MCHTAVVSGRRCGSTVATTLADRGRQAASSTCSSMPTSSIPNRRCISDAMHGACSTTPRYKNAARSWTRTAWDTTAPLITSLFGRCMGAHQISLRAGRRQCSSMRLRRRWWRSGRRRRSSFGTSLRAVNLPICARVHPSLRAGMPRGYGHTTHWRPRGARAAMICFRCNWWSTSPFAATGLAAIGRGCLTMGRSPTSRGGSHSSLWERRVRRGMASRERAATWRRATHTFFQS
mmetsp:Transcript_49939/g.115269  ORF Transcript_49939/g.115269 Transcript_49939/m.115269 type:complete len:234 (-) Transcript_49939:124-825(-)